MITVLSLALLMPAGCAKPAEVTSPKSFEWKALSMADSTVDPYSQLQQSMYDEIREKSNGRLNIRLVWRAQHSYTPAELLGVVSDRVAEIATVCNGHLTGYRDYFGVFPLPGVVVGSYDKVSKCSYEVEAPFIDKQVREHEGAFLTLPYMSGAHDIYSKQKLTSLAELKGLKVRCQDANEMALLASLGAIPVSVEFVEVYMALSRGTIDAAITGVAYANAFKWFEICKYSLELGTFANTFLNFVNLEAFNELPQDLQDIFIEAESKAALTVREELGPKAVADAWDGAKKNGVTITKLSPQEQAAVLKAGDGVVRDWLAKEGRSEEAKELVRLAREWLAEH
jgi:TRAP-type C4-dicarboxylate transport system substrate-binding protein